MRQWFGNVYKRFRDFRDDLRLHGAGVHGLNNNWFNNVMSWLGYILLIVIVSALFAGLVVGVLYLYVWVIMHVSNYVLQELNEAWRFDMLWYAAVVTLLHLVARIFNPSTSKKKQDDADEPVPAPTLSPLDNYAVTISVTIGAYYSLDLPKYTKWWEASGKPEWYVNPETLVYGRIFRAVRTAPNDPTLILLEYAHSVSVLHDIQGYVPANCLILEGNVR